MFYKTKKQQHQLLDSSEAYNLWDILKSKYFAAERTLLARNFAHDPDFKALMNSFLKSLQKDINKLEKEMESYGIKGPDKNRCDIKTAITTEAIQDKYIANDMFIFLQESIEMKLRAIRTSTTNDSIRSLFISNIKRIIEQTDAFIKYLKLKGWAEEPPFYPNIPAETNEKLDTGEAFHLWEHLTFRYDNLHQTDIYYTFAHDLDFKVILKTGLQAILKKQIKMLEKEFLHFGIPLPQRPTNVYTTPSNTQILDDDHMYRTLFSALTGVASAHGQALKQSTTNDRIRGIFKDLLYSEIDFIENLIKFGKIKSWLHPVPLYKLQ